MTTDTQIIELGPPVANLQNVVPGQTMSWRLQFYEEDDTTPIDITGDTFDAEIQKLDGTLFIAISTGNGITQTDTNEITCTLAPAETANFDHELTYEWQANWNVGADVIPCGYGNIDFKKPII